MAFKMKSGKEGPMKKNFPSVFKQTNDDEYQKNWKIIQGLKKDLASFKADLKKANEKGDTTMANDIKEDIEYTQRIINERKK